MADLKTDYKDDVLDTSVNEKRKWIITENGDGTVTITDATTYSQMGDVFGSADLNAITLAVNECFQSVSDGKALVASAITDKKVATDATATFSQMAENISKIVLGSGNATKTDVLSGKTFTNDDGVEYTGSMPNIKDIDDAITSQYVENGSSGSGIYARMNYGAHVKLAASGFPELFIPQNQLSQAIGLSADKIIKGNTILGIAGTALAAVKSQNGSFSFAVNPGKTTEYQVKFYDNFANDSYTVVYTVTSGNYKDYVTMTTKTKLASGFTLNVKNTNTGSQATGTISWIAE